MLDFKLTGVEDAIAALRRAVAPVNDERIGENAMAALEPIAEEARRLVPVDSGDLRDSIAISNTLADGGANGRAVYVGPVRAGDGKNVFYAHFIEFGTIKMRAYPFLAPAVFKHRELVFDVLAVRIGDDMVRAV